MEQWRASGRLLPCGGVSGRRMRDRGLGSRRFGGQSNNAGDGCDRCMKWQAWKRLHSEVSQQGARSARGLQGSLFRPSCFGPSPLPAHAASGEWARGWGLVLASIRTPPFRLLHPSLARITQKHGSCCAGRSQAERLTLDFPFLATTLLPAAEPATGRTIAILATHRAARGHNVSLRVGKQPQKGLSPWICGWAQAACSSRPSTQTATDSNVPQVPHTASKMRSGTLVLYASSTVADEMNTFSDPLGTTVGGDAREIRSSDEMATVSR